VKLEIKAFEAISLRFPVLSNIHPSGIFLMEDFYYSGGMRALIARLDVAARRRTLRVR